jgi:hypothetical protein
VRFDLSIKSKARASLECAHTAAQAAIAAAEAALVKAVDEIFTAEDAELEQQVAYHLDEGLRLGKQLLGRAITNEMNSRGHMFTETLQRLDLPLLDRRHLAVNFLREGDQADATRRAARRAAIISGVLPDKEARTA